MALYMVKTGWDVPLVELLTVTPQPRSTGVQAVDRTYGADGSVFQQGQFIELKWDVIETASDYADLLAQFGVNQVLFAEVTVFIPGVDLTFARFNGLAVRPEMGQDGRRENYYIRDVTMLIKELTAPA